MRKVSKRIVRDEADRPVAVQIDYADWLEIERALNLPSNGPQPTDLAEFRGVLKLNEDPIEYQRRIRAEWT